MKPLDEIKSILEHHKEELTERFKVKEIGIFGSCLRNEQHDQSDVDILVEFSKTPGFFTFIELENHLSNLVGAKVDLVMKSSLKPVIGEHILREVLYL